MEKPLNNKLLIITHDFYPDNSPRSIRWSHLVEYLVSHGYEIDVISSRTAEVVKKFRGANIHQVGLKIMKNSSIKGEKVPNNKKNSSTKAIRKIVFSIIRVLYKKLWKKVYWPDFACLWAISAKVKARELTLINHYHTVITVSHPYSGHLVGLYLKKHNKFNWIVDVGDPFSFLNETPVNNYRIYSKLNTYSELDVFRKANSVTVTTLETKYEYEKAFGLKKHIYVIPPLLSQQPKITKKAPNRNKSIRIVFIGTLYKNIRDPKFVLKLFEYIWEKNSVASDIELHFWGNSEQCKDDLLYSNNLFPNKIFIHETIAHNKINEVISEANVLLNIGNKTHYQLPSKLVEYISTGKPIINIAYSNNCSSIKFLEPYKNHISIIGNNSNNNNNNIGESGDILANFLDNLPNELSSNEINRLIKMYKIETIGAEYIKLIEKI